MISEIFIASNNGAKIERFKKLIEQSGLETKARTPSDVGLEDIDPEESGKTLAENAKIKARAYFGKVNLPILGNDAGFWVNGEGFVDAPKRKALEGVSEKELTKEEISNKLLEFWKKIATKHGGKVDAAWIEEFVLLYVDGSMKTANSKREVILTDQIFDNSHMGMPVRRLYISKATNKPSVLQTDEEEILELKPVADALYKLLS